MTNESASLPPERIQLGDIAIFEMGQSPNSHYVSDSPAGIPFLQGNAEFGTVHPQPRLWCRQPKKVCQPEDSLISVRAPVGALNQADQAYCIGRGLAAVRFHGATNPRYGAHLLAYFAPNLRRRAQGTTFEAVGKDDLASLEVKHLPEPEQVRIADVLDTLDEAIQQVQRVILKQEALYLGLQERFFTPAAIAGNAGWEEVCLADIADSITSGPRGWASYYAHEGDYFLRIGNLTRKHLDLRFDDVVKVKPPVGAEGVRTALAPGDLLISITADLGIIGVVPDWMGMAYINQHIARARLDGASVNPRFLGYQLSGLVGQKQFYRLNDVGAKAGLNLPTVGRLKVWLPTKSEQDQIAAALDEAQQALRQEETLLGKLINLKTGLSADLLTGKRRVAK